METWVSIFVIVAAAAIVLQAGILFGIYTAIKQASEKMTRTAEDLKLHFDPILSRCNVLLEDLQPRLTSTSADAAEITRIARTQAERFDRLFGEVVDRLRLQIIRADQLLSDALEEIENTGASLRKSMLGPVQQVSALVKGISAGIEFLRSGQKGADRAREQQDEELFI
jgi:hypothetical protein